MQYLKIIITLFFILYAKAIYAFVGQFLYPPFGIYYQIISLINYPYSFLWTIFEDYSFMHEVVQLWQLNFLIPGGILMDIGLLILAFALSLDARYTVQKPDKIVLSLTFFIPGLILNYILGWIAHFINFAIS